AVEAIDGICKGQDEALALRAYERRVSDGVTAWYDLIALFYKLQNLFTYYAVSHKYRESVIRILQGNLYEPDAVQRAHQMISLMNPSYEEVRSDPSSLPRPGALRVKVSSL